MDQPASNIKEAQQGVTEFRSPNIGKENSRQTPTSKKGTGQTTDWLIGTIISPHTRLDEASLLEYYHQNQNNINNAKLLESLFPPNGRNNAERWPNLAVAVIAKQHPTDGIAYTRHIQNEFLGGQDITTKRIREAFLANGTDDIAKKKGILLAGQPAKNNNEWNKIARQSTSEDAKGTGLPPKRPAQKKPEYQGWEQNLLAKINRANPGREPIEILEAQKESLLKKTEKNPNKGKEWHRLDALEGLINNDPEAVQNAMTYHPELLEDPLIQEVIEEYHRQGLMESILPAVIEATTTLKTKNHEPQWKHR